MVGFSDTHENKGLLMIFNNTAWTNCGDGTAIQARATPGSFHVALLTADPLDTQASFAETSYTGYAREAVAVSAGGWTVAADTVSNTAAITFGQNTVGTPTITHVALCESTTETTADIVCYEVLDTPLVMAVNDIPEFAIGALAFTLD